VEKITSHAGRPKGKYDMKKAYKQVRTLSTGKDGKDYDRLFIRQCSNKALSSPLVRYTLEKLFVTDSDFTQKVIDEYIKDHH